ncbi:DUF2268 domain-containing putative Zn-dependent protease [Flavobacterium sp. 25HG05S-40]|uniref:DUF2268 domain-containing putative Zn-dependent protease n=1 Tax=Flavobacterium sp. 25HG05S-40 TaxID=3458682 RepID=UPI004044537E
MKKKILLLLIIGNVATAQNRAVTTDITNFWALFDSIKKVRNPKDKINLVQKMYIDKGTIGLKTVINHFRYSAETWVDYIDKNAGTLDRIRPYTLTAYKQQETLDTKLADFKKVYPNLSNSGIYFVIGVGEFGGNAIKGNCIIGAEVIANDQPDWAVYMALHEYVHTQQTSKVYDLLAHCIDEGMADFVAELLLDKKIAEYNPSGYIAFGLQNEKEIWERFKIYLGSDYDNGNFHNWLYGSKGITINESTMKDLGYFMGYQICKSYYNNSKNKNKAIAEMLGNGFKTNEEAKNFLLQSGYVPDEDIAFVKNVKFGKITPPKENIIKVIYGYRIENNDVVFEYKIPKSMDKSLIKTVTIAGTFNNWNPNDSNYIMTFNNKDKYELRFSKNKFNISKPEQFKFVINENGWQNPPETALNVDGKDGNLILDLKQNE